MTGFIEKRNETNDYVSKVKNLAKTTRDMVGQSKGLIGGLVIDSLDDESVQPYLKTIKAGYDMFDDCIDIMVAQAELIAGMDKKLDELNNKVDLLQKKVN